MEAILLALSALTPLNVGMSIFGGLVFGYAFRNEWFHTRTIFLSILFVLAFSIGRIMAGITIGASGAGLVGTFLFLIYLAAALITRRIIGKKRPKL